MKQLNTYQVSSDDNLIYDSELPVEYDTRTITIAPDADGEIAKGQILDVAFDSSTSEATYSVHAKDGIPSAIVAEAEPYTKDDTEVAVSVITEGNIRKSKIVTAVDLTDKDIDELRKVGIVLK